MRKADYTWDEKEFRERNKSEYNKIHQFIRNKYGPASKCENPQCKNKSNKYEWALRRGKRYEMNVENFIQLCISCHRFYDMNDQIRQNLREKNLAKPVDPTGSRLSKFQIKGSKCPSAKKIYSIDKNGIREDFDYVELVRRNGYNPTAISMCLTGKAKTSHKKQWFYA